MHPRHVVGGSASTSTTPTLVDYASSSASTSSRASSPRSSQIDHHSVPSLTGSDSRRSSEEHDHDHRSSYSDSYDSSAEGSASVSSIADRNVRPRARAAFLVENPLTSTAATLPPTRLHGPSKSDAATTSSTALHNHNLAVDHHLAYGQQLWSGDEYYSSRVSSRAGSPAPNTLDGFDGYLSYRAGARSSAAAQASAAARSRSGFSTPPTPADLEEKESYEIDYYDQQPPSLLDKLSGSLTPDTSPILGRKHHQQRKPGWWSRRAETRRKNTISASSFGSNAPLLGTPSAHRHHSSKSHRESTSSASSSSSSSSSSPLIRLVQAILRQPYVPTQPITILFSILLFLCFAATLTTFLMNVLSSDREPLPWRQFCQEQRPFPHELADSLKPVNVFVGVFSVDAAVDRRNAIRLSYAKHSKPIDPQTGRPGQNVQIKFVLGRPRAKWSKRIALEMEMFDDIVVLDVAENMNKGKTFAFFSWANENATVPVYYTTPSSHELGPGKTKAVSVGFKKADYVVKADDDAFIVLSELERHLRLTPRQNTYWGYLIRNRFMGGEVYALSSDLVNYLSTYPRPSSWTVGKEDQRVAKWMRNHPNASSIHWITERCYIYDHPKAGTTYARGFTFPDHVEQVRLEGRRGISEHERLRRGGELWQSYSTVQTWKKPYTEPAPGLSIEEQVEALVEGGGRWNEQGFRSDNGRGPQAIKYDEIVFGPGDKRLLDRVGHLDENPDSTKTGVRPGVPDENDSLPSARTTRFGKDLFRDPEGVEAVHLRRTKRSEGGIQEGPTRAPFAEGEYEIYNLARGPFEDNFVDPARKTGSLEGSSNSTNSTSAPAVSGSSSSSSNPPVNEPTGQIRLGGHAYAVPFTEERFIPPATLRYDPATLSLRSQRMLGLPYGGTVAVHYLKRNEWFYETALALLGRDKMWDGGVDTPAHPYHPASTTASTFSTDEYTLSSTPSVGGRSAQVQVVPALWGSVRMYGSPIVLEDGTIVQGRRAEAHREILPPNAAVHLPGGTVGWAGRFGKATGGGRTMGMMALAEMDGAEIHIGGGEPERPTEPEIAETTSTPSAASSSASSSSVTEEQAQSTVFAPEPSTLSP